MELLEIVQETSASGLAQFLIATHSPLLLACAGATIYSFDYAPLRRVDCQETSHFRLYYEMLQEVAQRPPEE